MMSAMTTDLAVFIFVVGLRFGIPLLIPRFPLPAILAALVIDAADQTIFQQFTELNLDSYQGYDKALDIYYLSIAYLSTVRNWTDPFAARVAQFLWYYRLVGVVLFEMIESRALLIIFANTFEYFFIAYEVIRCWWDPRRLTHRNLVLMAGGIWIFIKLPQEYWLHVAQLDVTDFMKEDLFGVPADSAWGPAIRDNLWFVALVLVLAGAVAFGISRLRRVLAPADWPFTMDVDQHLSHDTTGTHVRRPVFSMALLEKVVLMTLISIIFANVIPGVDATVLQIAFAIAVLVTASTAVSTWMAGRGVSWTSTSREFGAMLVVNIGIVLAYLALL